MRWASAEHVVGVRKGTKPNANRMLGTEEVPGDTAQRAAWASFSCWYSSIVKVRRRELRPVGLST